MHLRKQLKKANSTFESLLNNLNNPVNLLHLWKKFNLLSGSCSKYPLIRNVFLKCWLKIIITMVAVPLWMVCTEFTHELQTIEWWAIVSEKSCYIPYEKANFFKNKRFFSHLIHFTCKLCETVSNSKVM